jgi:hypothetical protein
MVDLTSRPSATHERRLAIAIASQHVRRHHVSCWDQSDQLDRALQRQLLAVCLGHMARREHFRVRGRI